MSLWKHKSVFLQMLHQYSVPSNITPLYFFSSRIMYFGQKQPIKVQVFEIFECLGQNLSNSSCQFWTDKSIPHRILYHSSLPWHITPLSILTSFIFNFRQKGCYQGPNWETFKFSGETLRNSSCQFLEAQASFPF